MQRVKTIISSVIVFFLFLYSCKIEKTKQENDPEIVTIDVNTKDIVSNKKLSDLIEVDTIISLEYTEKSLIGRADFVKITNDRIYVLDRSNANALFCFNRQGKFINVFKEIGKGPLEFLRIANFSVFDTHVFVSACPHRLFKLDKDLRSVEEVKIDWKLFGEFNDADYILALNNDTLLMTGYSTDYRYNFYDITRNKLIANFSKSINENDDVMCSPPFNQLENGKIIGIRAYVDTVFLLTPEKLTFLKAINYEFPIPESDKLVLRKTNFMDRERSPEYMQETDDYWENDSYISFTFVYKDRMHYFFKDVNSEKIIIFRNDLTNDVFGCKYFPSNVHGYYKNDIIISISPTDLLNNIRDIKVKVPTGITPDSNPILVLYHPKFN